MHEPEKTEEPVKPSILTPELQAVIAVVLDDHLKAKKAKRVRWTIIGGIVAAYLIFNVAVLFYDPNQPKGRDYAALIRMDGMIGSEQMLSASRYLPVIRQAFDDKHAKGVVLVINSGGGQPAQSQLIHDAIRRNAERTGKRVIVVAEDYLASGAYLIAMSGEKIYAPTTAVVGSIGVVRSGYDLSELAERFGIKDRTYTAGANKAPFNPLVPPNEAEREKAAELLGELHQEFIAIVEAGRGERLDNTMDLYTGEVWTGRRAAALGLIDGHLDVVTAVKAEFDTEQVKPYAPKLGTFDLLSVLRGSLFKVSAMLDSVRSW